MVNEICRYIVGRVEFRGDQATDVSVGSEEHTREDALEVLRDWHRRAPRARLVAVNVIATAGIEIAPVVKSAVPPAPEIGPSEKAREQVALKYPAALQADGMGGSDTTVSARVTAALALASDSYVDSRIDLVSHRANGVLIAHAAMVAADRVGRLAALAELAAMLERETLDESYACEGDALTRARDLGYRAGHNDRARALLKKIERMIGHEG